MSQLRFLHRIALFLPGDTRNKTISSGWGNGDVELLMKYETDIDQVMEVIEQSYRIQADE